MQKNICAAENISTLFSVFRNGCQKKLNGNALSKTPVSAATIAIKQCQNILGTLNNKNILIIGASGKTGSIVLKDLLSLDGVNIYATSRTHDGIINHIDGAITVDYDKRYDNLDIYDAVISATSSPHIVLEKSRAKNAIKTCKKRVFIDLAVPRDIEVFEDEYTVYKNIDDLTEIADNNNRIKQQEIYKSRKKFFKNILMNFVYGNFFPKAKHYSNRQRIKLKTRAKRTLFAIKYII